MYHKHEGPQKKYENQLCILFHLQVDQWHTVVITQVVSLNNCYLSLNYCFIPFRFSHSYEISRLLLELKRILILLP